jgi:hypothetical protein
LRFSLFSKREKFNINQTGESLVKKLVSIIIAITFCSVLACAQATDKAPDRGNSELAIGGGKASVEYGRPAIRGRSIDALPVGTEWRMGSNSATTLTTDVNLKFGDKVIQKGKYILTAKRADESKWVLMIKTEDKSSTIEVPLTFAKVEAAVELLTIDLKKNGNGGKFSLQWGTFTLSTDFQKA